MAWVNRRRKLLALDDAWKARAGELTADALERIAAYPAAVQKRVAKNTDGLSWAVLKSRFERESRNLDAAKFDTVECRACVNRTGAEGDLFGVVEGKLGACLSCNCFGRKQAAWMEEQVAAATKGAAEVERVDFAWQLPEEKASSPKRTAKHPCAYCFADGETGEVTVCWGESPAAAKERQERERAERNAAMEARDAKRRLIGGAIDKICEACREDFDDGRNNDVREAIAAEIGASLQSRTEAVMGLVVRATLTWIADMADSLELADTCRAFPSVPRLAGVTETELAELLAAYPATRGEE